MFKGKKGFDGVYYFIFLLMGLIIGLILGLKLSMFIDPGILPF